MFQIKKHPKKKLYRITLADTPDNFEDWKVAAAFNRTCVAYQRELEKLGAHPEINIIPRNQWSRYQLWFDSETAALNAVEHFDAEALMRNMIGYKPPREEFR